MHESGCVGGLDAEEDLLETGFDHQLQQLGIVGEVDRPIGEERHLCAGIPPPADYLTQQAFHLATVADEVVVDDERGSVPAHQPQGVELGDQLLRGFQPGHAAVQRDDVAKFAVERAAA